MRATYARVHGPTGLWAAICVLLVGCQAGPSAPVAESDPPIDGSVLSELAGAYSGDWDIFYELHAPGDENDVQETVEGTCPGTITLVAPSVKERLEGTLLTGTYFITDAGDCAGGQTVTGEVINVSLREDGGINFGLDVPASDGNFFEDVFAGSGVQPQTITLLGCTIQAADINNHVVGSVRSGRLLGANSAALDCPSPEATTVKVKVSVDLQLQP